MLITFTCPQCQNPLEADTSLAGSAAPCPHCNAGVTVPKALAGPGATVGGFRIEKSLGKGGMGEVFLATQLSMDRRIALKVLPQNLAADEQFIQRFLHEVRVVARLHHPNIVTAHEAGQDDGTYFLAMEFVEGETIEARLHTRRLLPEAEALKLVRKVAKALAYAWDKHQILHRDIKPANIMLDAAGEVKVMDMGIAKSMAEESSLTMTGVAIGTPYYMSPEQARGVADIDFRADLYSLGATLYHLVTGSKPFDGISVVDILNKHINTPLPPPRERNPQLSEPCALLIEVMMAKDRDQRHPTWQALIEDIDRVLRRQRPALLPAASKISGPGGHSPQSVVRNPQSALPSTAARRNLPLIVGGAAIAAVVLMSGMVYLARPKPPPRLPVPAKTAVAPAVPATSQAKAIPVAVPKPVSVMPTSAPAVVTQHPTSPTGQTTAQPTSPVAPPVPPAESAKPVPAPATPPTATTPVPAPVAESATPPLPAAATDPAQATFATLLDQVAVDLAAQKFADALRHWQVGRAAPELQPLAEQVTAAGKLVAAVAQMPQRFLDSFNAEVGKTVTVELRSGKTALEIREVSATAIQTMVTAGPGKMGRTFTLADLSIRERLKRLGDGDTPERLIMRGILALEAERADAAEKLFAQAGGPLAEAFKRELERRATAATEAQAEAALKELLRASAKSTASLEPEALIASIRAKCISADQIKRTKERVEKFAKTWGASSAAKQILPIIEQALAYPFPELGEWTVPDLGMEFVWIPTMTMWVGKYEVTNGEYRKFKPRNYSMESSSLGDRLNGDRQPVVFVNFDDSTAYAAWLTERERQAGRLPAGAAYRLPTGDEWLKFARCGDGRAYPWGNDLPPKYGNYSGDEVSRGQIGRYCLPDYNDGFLFTCPVEKSGRNDWGLYGVGGNAMECTTTTPDGAWDTWRGASYCSPRIQDGLSCISRCGSGTSRYEYYGLRLVLSR